MKKILGLFVVLFSVSVSANLPDIVALVNDQPITKHDFVSRKNMVVILNKIEITDSFMELKLNRDILNSLIEEDLLMQHAQKIGATINKEEIDAAISSIEQSHNMAPNGMSSNLKEQGVDIASFRKKIHSDLIKQNIVNALSGSISVSQNELDNALINSQDQTFDIEAWIFTSKKNSEKSLEQMKLLKKRLGSCDKVDRKLYAEFAEAEKFDRKLKKMSNSTQSVVLDTKVDSLSPIYTEDDKFKLVFVCKKDRDISQSDLAQVETFLSNKKMSQKAIKFFKDLRAKAYVKTMIPG